MLDFDEVNELVEVDRVEVTKLAEVDRVLLDMDRVEVVEGTTAETDCLTVAEVVPKAKV